MDALKGAIYEREHFMKLVIIVLLSTILCASCSSKSSSAIDSNDRVSEPSIQPASSAVTNEPELKMIIKDFTETEILNNVKIEDLSDIKSLKTIFGNPLNESLVDTSITWEEIKVDKLRVIEYERFNAIFYWFNDNREFFGFLELKKGNKYSILNIGSEFNPILEKYKSEIEIWDSDMFSMFSTFNDGWDLRFDIITNQEKVESVRIFLGGI